jgi:hypothetical protein
VAKLKAIGFSFDPLGAVWLRNFNNLLLHKQMHGNCNPLQSARGVEGSLGRWVGQQRHLFHLGSLRDDRLRWLDSAGFIYSKSELDWERHFQVFAQQAGSERVPGVSRPHPHPNLCQGGQARDAGSSADAGARRSPCTSMQDPAADAITPARLSGWVSYQRDLLRRGRLRTDRQRRLEQAGIVWNVREEQWSTNLERIRRCLAASGISFQSPTGSCVSVRPIEGQPTAEASGEQGSVPWSGEGIGEGFREGMGEACSDSFIFDGRIFLEGGGERARARRGGSSWRQLQEQGVRERALIQWLKNQKGQMRRNELRADRLLLLKQQCSSLPGCESLLNPRTNALGESSQSGGGVRGGVVGTRQCCANAPVLRVLPSRISWRSAAQPSS